ncbi:MAG: hydroxymethylglutaryl-CoA reductase, degradative [Chloroflexi bacterium]|nr:hydroxymethylglutaryl-CoA reductase, degradative [Chloroflexota bacterium]
MMTHSSRISGFFKMPREQRVEAVQAFAGLSEAEAALLRQGLALPVEQADRMIENVVGVYGLPLGIATNFQINGRDYLVPMAIEEPSVVAGASFAARLVREGGGFQAHSDAPLMIGQLQILDVADPWAARFALLAAKERLIALANQQDPLMIRLGGGARDVEVRVIEESPVGPMLALHLLYDARDAMGANTVNTALEAIAPLAAEISGGRVRLRILSNLADRRLARAQAVVPVSALAQEGYSGEDVAQGIVEAYAFAASDPYRAATHNKGIMNGIDAVVLATGNDWRAIEAGAHAYAARGGRYTSLSKWGRDAQGNLVGTLELPMAVGTVGGATKVHPLAQVALKVLGVQSARELAEVVAVVGLAQNLAAIRALAAEGIQRGHMALHARQLAIAAGAPPERVDAVVARMVAEKVIRLDRAQEILREMS